MKDKKIGIWHCAECLENSLVEVSPHGSVIVHECFFCRSSRRQIMMNPISFDINFDSE